MKEIEHPQLLLCILLYLLFLGLSLRNTSKALVIFRDKKRKLCVCMELGFKDLDPLRSIKDKRVSAFIIDETVIQIGNQHFWLWVCIEPIHGLVLGIYISEERNMLVAERFIQSLVAKYGKHVLYRDGGT